MHPLLEALASFVWTPECPACGRESAEDLICRSCAGGFSRIPVDERVRREDDGPLDLAAALLRYEEPARSLVLGLKYGQDTHPAKALGVLLAEEMRFLVGSSAPDVVVPIPLSRRRLRERGFNQAELLARPVAAGWDLPLVPRLLVRRRHTSAQAGLSGQARRRNLQDAFLARDVFGRSVLLVDDVITTGSTLQAAALALRAAGARRVTGLGLCRADGTDDA